jgi:hypothetical protein
MRTYRFSNARAGRRRQPETKLPVTQRSLSGETVDTLPASVEETLEQPGKPLDSATRSFMESRFHHDFSAVRVHTDSAAAQSARAIDARAYTAGKDIAFAPGEYAPQAPGGRFLLAHELAHVAQPMESEPAIAVSNPGDPAEVAADRAAATALSGGAVAQAPARRASISRQAGGPADLKLSPSQVAAVLPSQGETAVQSFLRRMWAKQSDSQQQFRVTDKVREGLKFVFGFDPIGAITLFDSADELFEQLKPKIPADIPPMVMARLDRLPNEEKKLPEGPPKPTGEPAKPAPGPPGTGPAKAPEKPKDLSDAAEAALKEAFRRFSETELGKQLEKSVKSYALSVEGIPFDIIVAGSVLTFVAANDPKLPSPPDIPLGEGIKIKVDISGRASDLPPLVRDLVHGRSTAPPGKEETKVGLSVEVTNEGAVEMAKAVGHFFAEAARWFARGVVKIGDAISKAGINLLRALGVGLAGAALGGVIGGLAGGGLGAAIGAGAGFLLGAGTSVVVDLIRNKSKKKEPAP